LGASERSAYQERITDPHQSIRLGRLAVDLNLAGPTRVLRLRPRAKQADDIEPDIEPQADVRRHCYLGGRFRTNDGPTYATISAITPITAISSTLCLIVKRNRRLSSADVMPVAATATAML